MGSSCSSVQKKKDKKGQESQSPAEGNRRRSTDSIPYGKSSPAASRRTSRDQAPLAEEDSSLPEVIKRPVDAAISQTSTIGGDSTSPPPSAATTGTPVVKDAPSLDTIGLPDLQQFPEQVRGLLLGRIGDPPTPPPLQEIMLYVAADFSDSGMERSILSEKVFPVLRRRTAEKGYDLNVTDLHLGIGSLDVVDHSLRELCLETLNQWKAKRRVITLVLFNDNIGEELLPQSLPRMVLHPFLDSLSNEEDQDLFRKWYLMDENACPAEYKLQPVTAHYPDVSSDDVNLRSEAIVQWHQQANKMLQLLREVLPDGQRAKFLASVLEEEIKAIVTTEDPQDAKRVLWMQRRFSHTTKSCNGPSPDSRRIDKMKVQLEDYLPDTQKFVLYVKWHEGPLDGTEHEGDEQYLTELCSTLKDELSKMIDSLLEEDFLEEAQTPYRGVESQLYLECVQQYRRCKSLSDSFSGQESALQAVQEYLTGPGKRPLVVFGDQGCGKSTFLAKCVQQCESWVSSAPVVYRLVGVTAESSTFEQLLRSVLEQCCALYGEHPSVAFESVDDWSSGFERLLEKVSESRPLVVMIDGIDESAPYSRAKELQWLPNELPQHVKLVLTVKKNSPQLEIVRDLLKDDECFFELQPFTPSESMSTMDKFLKSNKRCLTEAQRNTVESYLQNNSSASAIQLLSQMALRWTSCTTLPSLENVAEQYLLAAESYLSSTILTSVLGLHVSAKQGVSDSEMLDILSCDEKVLDLVFRDQPSLRRFPAALWALCKRHLEGFISTNVSSGKTLSVFRSQSFRTAAVKYLESKEHDLKTSTQSLVDYFLGKWSEGKKKPTANDSKDRLVIDQPLAYGSNPNRRKLEELPYQVLQLEDSIRENFLFDATWLLYKVCGTDPYQLLEDIVAYENKTGSSEPETQLLISTVQLASYALRCDGSQFFAQIYGRLKAFFADPDRCAQYPSIKSLFDASCQPPLSNLLPLGPCLKEPSSEGVVVNNCVSDCPTSTPAFSGLYTIKEDQAHVISLSCNKGELIVWNIHEQTPIRKLTGINQPKDIKMLDRYRALVLCNRELKVYHLDEGRLVVKLKGVMNQKMAYYGLHDDNYVVALSRNRMYVNMTNLTTGDLETTFKVGEDRFLNSLLVSANGRICVCGDETQKPFPLLVWDLTSRKLVYDLRIPHHEFVTRLSAISDDGHYVVSVCRELHDTSPNFIIVYDLQSGTLFKKWKPESSSCSIAISSQGGCVVNGLENTWVLVWDLSTGARRYTLRGHCAPVDQIRMGEEGTRCLTYDSRGRDRSLRVWDVLKGECLAVFTPDQHFSCCELSPDGQAVILGLQGRQAVTTLLLCRETAVGQDDGGPYGDEARKNQVFDMSQDGQ